MLPARRFDAITSLDQHFHQGLPVIALNFDHARFHRAAAPADLLELFCEFPESIRMEGNPADQSHPFTPAPLRLPRNPHRAGAHLHRCFAQPLTLNSPARARLERVYSSLRTRIFPGVTTVI
jgi:hypothetical protein